MIRLDIGCGDACAPGWTGVDPFYDAPGIVKAPAWLLPYKDGSVAAIRCSHALEHLPANDVPAALAEFRRVLEPHGELWIAVPDSLYVLQTLIDAPDDPWSKIMVYGQDRWVGDAHRSAFAPDTLDAALTAAGFVEVKVYRAWTAQQNQISIIAEARTPAKPKRRSKRPTAAAKPLAPSSGVRLSVIIPTVGRPSLARTLASVIDGGIAPEDQVVIVNDGDVDAVHGIVEAAELDGRCKVMVAGLVPPGGDYGQPARNFGMMVATGTHLVFTQDDNVFAPGALDAVRHEAELAPERLHFWRVKPQCGTLVWSGRDDDGLPVLGHIDADCGVVPNDPARLGKWGEGYNGDYVFWRETAENFGARRIEWHEEMIAANQRFL